MSAMRSAGTNRSVPKRPPLKVIPEKMSFWRSATTWPICPTSLPSEANTVVPFSSVIQETGALSSVMAADTRPMRAAPLKLARISVCFVVLGLLPLAACTGEPERGPAGPAPDGPAEVEVEAVEEHAAQFDEDLSDRPAGSQQEFAAATYLTGHLQRAGYEVRLESVPYKDTV